MQFVEVNPTKGKPSSVRVVRLTEQKSTHNTDGDKVDEDADATEKSCEKASKNIRKVILPKLKFHATNYYHMIDWDTKLKTQLPLLTSLSDEEVLHI